MKFACEMIVYEVLPTVRRDLAKELIESYGMNQKEVAKLFNITSVAVCQYMKGVRGSNELIYKSSLSHRFSGEISKSAKRLAEGKSDITKELCILCAFAKQSGMLDEMNENLGNEEKYARCQECPNKDYDGFVDFRSHAQAREYK